MIKEDIEKNVIDIVADQLQCDADSVKLESVLIVDLGYDSLDDVETLMAIEMKYNIEVSDVQSEEVKTVQDIVNLIVKLTGEK